MDSASYKNRQDFRHHELDALRGVAALAVVISHVIVIVEQARVPGGGHVSLVETIRLTPLGGLTLGLPAVLLFFTLSGFALAAMLDNRKFDWASYAARRISRIWIPYFFSVLFAIILYYIFGWPKGDHAGAWLSKLITHDPEPLYLLSDLVLVWPTEWYFNFVAWTLAHELRISLIFPLVWFWIASKKINFVFWFFFCLSFFAVAARYTLKYFGFPATAELIASAHYLLFFVCGALLWRERESVIISLEKLGAFSKGAILLFALCSYSYPERIKLLGPEFKNFPMLLTHWMMLPGCVLIIALALGPLKKALLQPTLLWLGRISYSIYLFHGLILIFSCHLVHLVGLWPAMTFGFLMSAYFATLMHKFIEIPAQNYGRRFQIRV